MRNYLTNGYDFGFNFIDSMFDDFFKPMARQVSVSSMRTDINETEKEYNLSIDMPGFNKEDINLSLENGYLRVEAKREEKDQDKKNYITRERSYSCSRSYYVGDAVTEEDVIAKYVNGTLSLTVPKKEKELPQRKQIRID